jgi:uncharacterized membrane protein
MSVQSTTGTVLLPMKGKKEETSRCQICGRSLRLSELLPGELVRQPVVSHIQKYNPDWAGNGYICKEDLNHFRGEYIKSVIETDKGELSALEEQVLKSLKEYELLSSNINVEFDRQLTFGEKMADRIADFGGSWRFIIIFTSIIISWVILNSVLLVIRPFDPYPYILLNLVLSCLAAMQAPVIMMSQNRQEDRDRLRAENDYRVNLKAELEIRHLHEKLDHLLMKQWQRLLEIQEVQLDIMEELARSRQ